MKFGHMNNNLKQQIFIDPNYLRKELDIRLNEEAPPHVGRQILLKLIGETIGTSNKEIRRQFEHDQSLGSDTIRSNALLVDQILKFAIETIVGRIYPTAQPTSSERLCFVAVGGYGRSELAPSSDVDLLFLLPYRLTPRTEQIVESLLYLLWDLGFKVGHATRSMEDCIRLSREDITIRTALLEARFLSGNTKLFAQLRRSFWRDVSHDTRLDFVKAKLVERDKRHIRMGDSRYVLEPNVKDGKGGLRDLQTLFWIAKYLYRVETVSDLTKQDFLTSKEVGRFSKAENFLWTVRCHLHYLTGRAEDRLTFDLQSEISKKLGYKDHAGTRGIERFMKHYYLTAKEVGDLTRIFCAALEAEQRQRSPFSFFGLTWLHREISGFPIETGRLSVSSAKEFAENPTRMLLLFAIAQKRELDIHPKALRSVTRHLRRVDTIRNDPEANRLFLEILTSPKGAETTLRRMNEAGLFGRFVPDFGRVVAQMQHDMYHVFTVDEHTIFAIGILHGIERGNFQKDMPLASDVVAKISSRQALFVALFLHDIAKGRGGDHSLLGARVAEQLCPRLGLNQEETETVSWLVKNHLLMSRIAFHRDLGDPKSINDFLEEVQSLERLRLLFLLTIADICAVGPNVWNNWKGSLLRELYFASEALLFGGHDATGREKRINKSKEGLRILLDDWSEEDVNSFFALGSPSYWLSLENQVYVRHAQLVRKANESQKDIALDATVDEFNGITELTIYTPDNPGLFSKIAGAMALSGANIVDAKAFTMTNGMALDVFSIQNSARRAFKEPTSIERLKENIRLTLKDPLTLARKIKKLSKTSELGKVFTVVPRVLINNFASQTHSVVEINSCDRAGLLYEITEKLTHLGLQISSALIMTYGERAVDVFYLKDAFGMQITHKGKLGQIRRELLKVISDKHLTKLQVEHSTKPKGDTPIRK